MIPSVAREELLAFVERLRSADVKVTTKDIRDWMRAINAQASGAPTIHLVVDTALVIFVRRREDRAIVGRVLADWMGVHLLDDATGPQGTNDASRGAVPVDPDEMTGDRPSSDSLAFAAGSEDRLARRDHRDLTAEERRQVNDLIAAMVAAVDPGGPGFAGCARGDRIDVGATVLHMLADGGELGALHFQDRPNRRRRTVMLIDVSRSMSAYSESLLRFAHAVIRSNPDRTEVFTFSTRLTRITNVLGHANPDAAMAAAGRLIPDWHGGTALGAALQDLLRKHGKGSALRGADAVVASDGWCSDPELATEQMARMVRLARRVIWADPQAGIPEYRPRAAVVRQGHNRLFDVVPCHSVASLRQLAVSLSHAPRSQRVRHRPATKGTG